MKKVIAFIISLFFGAVLLFNGIKRKKRGKKEDET